MDIRGSLRILLIVASALIVGIRPAAAVDVSGRWGVVVHGAAFGGADLESEWDFEQTGTQLVLTITYTAPPSYTGVTEGPFNGTIDPDTGAFTVDFPGLQQQYCGGGIDGVASPDGLSISGNFRDMQLCGSPMTGFECCGNVGPFSGGRCPGATGCCAGASCCGNGFVSPEEECDDHNVRDGDCCSSTCHFESAGTPCDQGTVCTVGGHCDGAGSCQLDDDRPCGTLCRPGTCSAGQCVLGAPAPDTTPCDDGSQCSSNDHCSGGFCSGTAEPETTPCDDGDVCTIGDHCGSGNFLKSCLPGTPAPITTPCDDHNVCTTGDHCFAAPGGQAGCVGRATVTCAPCEVCDRSSGCVVSPMTSCGADTSSSLALSIRKSGRSSVSWRRSGGPFGLVGDPTADTVYDVCIFDASDLLFQAAIAPGGTCGAHPCWRATSDGFRYGDRTGTSGGVKKLWLERAAGSLDVKVSARGANVELPPSFAAVGTPIVAELRAHDSFNRVCWQTRFPQSDVTTLSTTRLRARH